MSILRINNSINSYQSQNDLRSFKGVQNNEDNKPFSEQEIRFIAQAEPKEKIKKAHKDALGTIFISIPVADSILSGLIAKGSLATKANAAAKKLGMWGLVILSYAAFNNIRNKISQNSDKVNEFRNKHKGLTLFADVATAIGMYSAVFYGALKGKSLIKKVSPKLVNNIRIHIKKPLRTALNNSKLNQNYIIPMNLKYMNNDKVNRALNITSRLFAPVMTIATLLKFSHTITAQSKKVTQNYAILSSLNEQFAQADNQK